MKLRLLLATLLFSALSCAQVPTNGLVKEYDFTFGSGNQHLISNVQSTLQSGDVNLTRTGLNGNIIGDRFDNPQSAAFLNGDYYQSGGTEQQVVNEYTISFWIKTATVDNNSRRIVDQKGAAVTRGFSVQLFNGKIQFQNYFGYGNTSITNSDYVVTTAPNTIADGTWHHVACVVNSSATSMVFAPYVAWTINYYSKIYIDNVLVATGNKTVTPSYTSGQLVREAISKMQPLYLGSYPGNTTATHKFTEYIDQVKYYERELTDSEIGELYYEGHPQSPIYVNANATGNNDGTSWADAYTNLQSAINNNPFKDDIWVAQGTYTPSGSGRESNFFIDSNVKIYGGFNGIETLLEERDFRNNITILNGDVNGNDNTNIAHNEATRYDNLYHIMKLKGNLSDVVIDGFTFSGANANGGVQTTGNAYDQYFNSRGGAVYAHIYSPGSVINAKFNNCTFEKNTASDIGAVYSNIISSGVTNINFDVDFTNCIVRNNYTYNYGQLLFVGSSGYSIFHTGSFVNCVFHDNTASYGASAVYFFTSTANGGNSSGVEFDIINSTFSANTGYSGNVLRLDNSPLVRIKNTIIYGNGSNTPIYGATSFTAQKSFIQGAQLGGWASNPFLDAQFVPTSSSAAINNGDNSYLPANIVTDLAGNNRFVGVVDIGAYEYDAALSSSSFSNFQDFSVYPNPTNGIINIRVEEEIKLVEMYSLDGRKLLETQNTFLDISNYPSGIYFLTLETENGKIGTQKIIKK